MRCAVKNCKNTNDSKACGISFFTFPTDAALLKEWITFCGQSKKINKKTSHICMEHFKPEDIENNLQYEMGFTKRRILRHGVVPSINKSTDEDGERAEIIKKRENKKIVELLLEEHQAASVSDKDEISQASTNAEPKENVVKNFSSYANADLDEDNIKRLGRELKLLHKENLDLRMAQKKQIAEWKDFLAKFENDVNAFKTQLTKSNFKLSNLEEQLFFMFAAGQTARLKAGIRRTTWAEEDYAQSVAVYAESAKLYKLLYKTKFSLPSGRSHDKLSIKNAKENV